MSSTACFTGHRPKDLPGGYDDQKNAKLWWALHNTVVEHIEKKGVISFISGMAVGVDIAAAKIAIKLKEKYPDIKLVLAIPCRNQSDNWPEESKRQYKEILSKADEIIILSEVYTNSCMQERNIYMVDRSDYVIAVSNGSKTGGTANCIKYATKRGKNITKINPNDIR